MSKGVWVLKDLAGEVCFDHGYFLTRRGCEIYLEKVAAEVSDLGLRPTRMLWNDGEGDMWRGDE